MGGDPLELARFTLELEERLALFFVLGPPDRAAEVLRFVRAHLPEDRPTAWHRLDRDGLDLEAAAQAAGEGAIVLVHGLERLTDEDQLWAVSLINLHRDRLGRVRGALVLFVPEGEVTRFVQRAPDLWSWRTQVLEIGADQVPLPEPEARRRRFLLAQLRSLDFIEPPGWWMRADRGRMTQRAFFIEPEILGPTGEITLLSRWAEGLRRGLITGPVGSGRKTALIWLAWKAAERALEDPEAPVPLVLGARDWESLVERKGGDLAELLVALSRRLGLADALCPEDASFGLYVHRMPHWLEAPYPLVRLLEERASIWRVPVVVAVGEATEGRAGWMPGGVQPWDDDRILRWASAASRARSPRPRSRWELEHQALFASMFSHEEPAELLASSPPLRPLCADLPPALLGRDALAWELSRLLERHDLADASWFALWHQARPRRGLEIDELAAGRADPARRERARLEEPAPTVFADAREEPDWPHVCALATRPLLLGWGAAALIWSHGSSLAERVHELITAVAPRSPHADEVIHLWLLMQLSRLALGMSLEEQTRCLADHISESGASMRVSATTVAEIGVRQIQGLFDVALVEQEGRAFRFSFQVLQDWFAARGLAEMDRQERDSLILERQSDPRWTLILEFYTWHISRP